MYTSSTISDVLRWLETRPDIHTVRAAACDLNGVMRGKRIPADQAIKIMENKLRMPLSVAGLDIWGGDIDNNPMVFKTGDVDGIAAWTGRNILPVEWTAHPTAFLPVWLQDDAGAPYLGDPRRALAAVLARYKALGMTPVTAVELEFHLVDASGDVPKGAKSPITGRNLDTAAAMAMEELDQFEAYFHEVYAACKQQDIPVDTTIAENGSGQFEINLGHLPDALRAADDAVFFKRTVKGIARKHGFAASFMAKPYGNFAGNGLHIHMSLLDRDGNNMFDDGTDQGTDMMRHAVGGLLAGMAESTLIFAPHYNSYRRLRPNSYAPTSVAWGYENRMVAVRIPGGPHQARRIEHRVAGADANPYLVMAAMLGAALIGIERTMPPGDPRRADAYANDLPKLPNSWRAAADAFDAGPMVADIFAPELVQSMLACKRQEMDIFAAHVSPFEHQTYLESV